MSSVEHLPGDFRLKPGSGKAGTFIKGAQWLIGDGWHDYEHAQVYVGNGFFVDAQPGGAVLRHYNDVERTDHRMWSSGIVHMTDAQREAVVHAAYSYIGTPYSYLDYVAIAVHYYHIHVPYLRKYIISTKHMICSQLVDRCLLDAGVHLFNDNRWCGYVTPGDLYQLLMGKDFGYSPYVF